MLGSIDWDVDETTETGGWVGESNLAEPKSYWGMLYQMGVSESQHKLFFVFVKPKKDVFAWKVYQIEDTRLPVEGT